MSPDEPQFQRLCLPADRFIGATPHRSFASQERWHAERPSLRFNQRSQRRRVLPLVGGGGPSSLAVCRFDLAELGTVADADQQFLLRIRGMWDFQAEMPESMAALHQQMPTIGRFAVRLGERTLYQGRVFFWNYRQWRFWPAWELDVPADALAAGEQELRIENLTRPFFDDLPEQMYQTFPELRSPEARECVPAAVRENTLFHLAEVQLVRRGLHDLEILNAPPVVSVGERFRVEVYARSERRLETELDPRLTLLSEPSLRLGRNVLWLRAEEAAAGLCARLRCPRTGRTAVVQVGQAVEAHPAAKLWLGHVLGGHLPAFPLGHDYRRAVELFRDTGQGNLVGWLSYPPKAGDWIGTEQVPVADIHASGLDVHLRFNQAPASPYKETLTELMDALGDRLLGATPHEYGAHIQRALQQTSDRKAAFELFQRDQRAAFESITGLRNGLQAWVNDPSLFTDVYRAFGSQLAGVELFPLQCNLNIASARGTARAWGDGGWSAINSFECQAYGGLEMSEPLADDDPRFDEKRGHLWWLSLFHTYLAGARVIYSESGPFHHVVSRQWDFEDAALVEMRASQRALGKFSAFHALAGQPLAGVAFVKSPQEVFSGRYAPRTGQVIDSDLTWERVRVAWPELRWHQPELARLAPGMFDRPHYAATPLGEADVVNADISETALRRYPALVLVGAHRITRDQARRLRMFVEAGGDLVFSHHDLLGEDPTPDAVADTNLEELTGLRRVHDAGDHFLWQVETVHPTFEAVVRRFQQPHCDSTGGFGGAVLRPVELSEGSDSIVTDRLTGIPLLVRRRLGRGHVWFFNVVEYPRGRNYYALTNELLTAILQRLKPVSVVCDHPFVNAFVYPAGEHGRGCDEIYLINNDWFSEQPSHIATLTYRGSSVALQVPRRGVRIGYGAAGLLALVEHGLTRVNVCEPEGGTRWRLVIQGDAGARLRFVSLTGAAMSLRSVSDGVGVEGTSITITKAGVHVLSVELVASPSARLCELTSHSLSSVGER